MKLHPELSCTGSIKICVKKIGVILYHVKCLIGIGEDLRERERVNVSLSQKAFDVYVIFLQELG
jgi:hypothetical protein